MFLQIGPSWVRLIGDPHLGKKFQNGVPLHRRGERELGQLGEFMRQLMDTKAPDGTTVDAVIIMGDLFDGFNISNEVLLSTYKQVAAAATRGLITGVQYLILMGNHDVTRNQNLKSSFDLLEAMALPANVKLVKEIEAVTLRQNTLPILLCPYDAFTSTAELFTEERFSKPLQFGAIFGHWDTQSFGGSDHNLLPYNLSELTTLIVTGHEHNAREFMHGQTKVIVTGSMLPYSFAEDEHENLYVTRSLSEYLENPQAYSDKCLRLLVRKGEEIPENIDALQLQIKYVNEEQQEEVQVVTEDFSMKALFKAVMDENSVSDEQQKHYWERYEHVAQA